MTEEEADALDEEYTRNPPMPGPNGTGAWSRWRSNVAHIIAIDDAAATYLRRARRSRRIRLHQSLLWT